MKQLTVNKQYGKITVLLILLTALTVTVFLASCSKTEDENIIRPSTVSDSRLAATPVEVSLSDSEMEVGICTIHEITAVGGRKISWTSSDESVATVDNQGRITGIKAGECDITAANEFGKTAQCHIQVKKSVFLTIDDGPLGCCSKILNVLKTNDVKATFFVVKTHDIEMVKRIHDEGHCIGLHTYSHDFSKCYRSDYSYFSDLEKLKSLIYDYTGETPDIVRFPGGTSNTMMNRLGMRRMVSGLDDLGYRVFDWTASSGDATAERISYDRAASNVLRNCYKDVNIVLMHDWEPAPKSLRVIISYLKEKGFTFDTLDHYAEHSFRTKTKYEKSKNGDTVIPCTAVSLNENQITVLPGKSVTIKATIEPAATTDYLRFVSDDPSIASVTLEGEITGNKTGTTNIRAIASSGAEAVCAVTVE